MTLTFPVSSRCIFLVPKSCHCGALTAPLETLREIAHVCAEPSRHSANVDAPGLVNFVAAVAYHFCLNLPAALTQPASTFADLCNVSAKN